MKNQVDVHIGQRVRNRRWLQGMTQKQLADAIGVRFQQVQKYESGTNRISAAKIWAMARVLDVATSFFFDGLDGPGTGQTSDGLGDAVLRKETIDLVRAFYRMDEGKRRSFLDLTKAIGNPVS